MSREAKDFYRGEREFWVTFMGDKQWRVHVNPMAPVEADVFEKPHTKSLARRLSEKIVEGRLKDKQQEALYFLHANWESLVDIFYTADDVNHRQKPMAFVQVALDEEGRQCADFVGIGPDGKVFLIVAASDSRSSNQELQRQYDLLQRKFGLKTSDIVPRIVNFVQEQKVYPDGTVSSGRFNIYARILNGASMEG